MTLKQEIIDELREKLELSDTTRKAILDQLALIEYLQVVQVS